MTAENNTGERAVVGERASERKIEESEGWHISEKGFVITHKFDHGSNSEEINVG